MLPHLQDKIINETKSHMEEVAGVLCRALQLI
jgi:hypothetical protein